VVVYVDLEKAYDRVNRELLWAKLAERGMPAGLIDAVKVVYADVQMCVRSGGELSRAFATTVGVKQGCPMSCTLWGLYFDDAPDVVIALGAAAELPELCGRPVPSLMFADDLAHGRADAARRARGLL
jgi:hypothetical protein